MANNKKRRRKIKGNLAELKKVVTPTKEFEFPDPDAVALVEEAESNLEIEANRIPEAEIDFETAKKIHQGLKADTTKEVKEEIVSQLKIATKVLQEAKEDTEAIPKAEEKLALAKEALKEAPLICFTIRKLSPGHILQLRNTAMIKAYEKAKKEEKDNNNPDAAMEAFNNTLENIEFSAQVTALAVIDPDTDQTILTFEEVMEYMLPEWCHTISLWALGGATPQDDENPDDVDTFSDSPEE